MCRLQFVPRFVCVPCHAGIASQTAPELISERLKFKNFLGVDPPSPCGTQLIMARSDTYLGSFSLTAIVSSAGTPSVTVIILGGILARPVYKLPPALCNPGIALGTAVFPRVNRYVLRSKFMRMRVRVTMRLMLSLPLQRLNLSYAPDNTKLCV